MRIKDVTVMGFRHPSHTVRDAEGHRHPRPGARGHRHADDDHDGRRRRRALFRRQRGALPRGRAHADGAGPARPGALVADAPSVSAAGRGGPHRPQPGGDRSRAVGSYRPGPPPSGVQVARRVPRLGAGVRQHDVRRRSAGRLEHARGIRRFRAGAPRGGVSRDQAAHVDAAARPRPAARRRRVPRRARAGRPRRSPDAGLLSRLQPHRRALHRPRARGVGLLLVRGADERAEA